MVVNNYKFLLFCIIDYEVGWLFKIVMFYINGDWNFCGYVMVLIFRRFWSVEIFLMEFGCLRYFKDLFLGVCYLFLLESGMKVDNFD